MNRHAPARLLADLGAERVEERRDLNPLAEAGVVGQRETQVARPDDTRRLRSRPRICRKCRLRSRALADTPDAELAEVRVLPNLGGVEVKLLGQRLRQIARSGFRRVQAAQVDGQTIGGELGHLVAVRLAGRGWPGLCSRFSQAKRNCCQKTAC